MGMQIKKSKWVGYEPPYSSLDNPRKGLDAIYLSGRNNLYSYHLKYSILGSPTGAMAHRQHVSNISSIELTRDYEINKRKELLLSSLIRNAAVDLSIFQFYAIHINYKWDGENFNPVNPTILPAEDVRLNKQDDHGYYSKVFVDDWREVSTKNKNKTWYYKYNPNTSAIFEQIRKDAKDSKLPLETDEDIEAALSNYRGQVRVLNFTGEFPYPIPMADSVLPDLMSEHYISLYTVGETVNGFISKSVAFIKDGTNEENEEIFEDMVDWVGTEGTSGIYVMPVKSVEDIDKVMKVVNFTGNFDDGLFDVTEKRLRRNILQAFDNLPEILVYSGDGSLFGTNPETWKNAENYYFENTAPLRNFLKRTIEQTLKIEL